MTWVKCEMVLLFVFRLQEGSILQGWPLQDHLLPWRPESREAHTRRLLWHQGSALRCITVTEVTLFLQNKEINLRFLCCSSSRWQISKWPGSSVRRRWTGRRHRADSRRSFGINSAASATRVCRDSTTSPSSGCSLFSSSHEVWVSEWVSEADTLSVWWVMNVQSDVLFTYWWFLF